MEDLLLIVAMLGFYPMMVLWIALTGPHNEAERRERQRYLQAKRGGKITFE